jgi:hypothetical protein
MSQDSRKQYKTYQDIYRERLAVLANASAASALSPRQAGSGPGAASPPGSPKGHRAASTGLRTQARPSQQMSGPSRTRGRAASATLHSLDDVTPSAGAAASAPAPTGATLGGLDDLETVSPMAVTPPSASGSHPAGMQGPRFGRCVTHLFLCTLALPHPAPRTFRSCTLLKRRNAETLHALSLLLLPCDVSTTSPQSLPALSRE